MQKKYFPDLLLYSYTNLLLQESVNKTEIL